MPMIELNNLKNDTARKKKIRKRLAEIIQKALIEEFGEENVIYIPTAIYPCESENALGTKINCDSVAVKVGEVDDKDGFCVDVVAVVSPVVKPFNTVLSKSGKITPAINLYDIVEAIEAEGK